MTPIDEVTARRWARHGNTVCPMCEAESNEYPLSLGLVREQGQQFLSCPCHGKLFDVRAA